MVLYRLKELFEINELSDGIVESFEDTLGAEDVMAAGVDEIPSEFHDSNYVGDSAEAPGHLDCGALGYRYPRCLCWGEE